MSTQKTRSEIFNEHQPDLTEQEALQALQALRDDKIVLSLTALPICGNHPDVDFLAVRFVLADGSVQTINFDRFAGSFLQGILHLLEQGGWHATQTSPTGLKPN